MPNKIYVGRSTSRLVPQPYEDQNTSSEMNDNTSGASRSKRRRQRRKNRKLNENQCDNTDDNPASCDNADNLSESKLEMKSVEEIKIEYRVDSPDELAKQKKKLSQNPSKSKSLDDDEMVKIQELSEASETEEKENRAIVLEAPDSDVDWEEIQKLKTSAQLSKGNLSTLTLTIEDYDTNQVTLISPEEESKLRNFLESLNLVNGPEEAAKQVIEQGGDNPKVKKAQKRAALEEYFLPIAQNPRYLDVISEEPSDRESDKEQPSLTRHLKRGTPELEVPEKSEKPPAVPPRSNRDKRKSLPKRFVGPVEQPPAVLVGTKILENPKEGFCTTVKTAEASSTVEVVYLDSSESNSPSNESEKTSSNEEIPKNGLSSESDTLENSGKGTLEEDEDEEDKTEEIISGKIETDVNPPMMIFKEIEPRKFAQDVSIVTCKKDKLAQESKTYEELSGKNETITTATSTKYSFVVKTKDCASSDKTILENGIMQLTPPPTPENMSPKNEINSSPSFAKNSFEQSEKLDQNENSKPTQQNLEDSNETCSYQKFTTKSNESVEGNKQVNAKLNTTINLPNKDQNAKEIKKEVNFDVYKMFTEKGQVTEHCSEKRVPEANVQAYKNDNELLVKEDAAMYTRALSPPPPSRSPSISSSSSKDSSLCTAKYNPLNSSISDISSLREEEQPTTPLFQPITLREACVKFLINLPFGADVLQELADVSLSIESFTSNLPSTILSKIIPTLPAFVDSQSDYNNYSDLSVNMSTKREWVGMPTEKDPKLLVCLSPKQKEELEKTKAVSDEAAKLIELHEKYINRRSCQEDVKKEVEEKVTITSMTKNSSNVSVTSPTGNRLLDIIKEEPITVDENASEYLYFVDKGAKKDGSRVDDARLKAKNLTEWLNLARNKSMSESNLHTLAEIPENNLRKDFITQPTTRRRTSLPHDLLQRQMLYLQEKEREIQRQLEQLEEEKRKINAEMASSREFQIEDYRFSRKGDFAENKNATPRPTSMPAMPTEVFRQQMYEEYLDQFAKREERKHQKVIKVTSATNKDANEDNVKAASKEIIHPVHLEKEFLEKVKQKQQEGKLGKNRESVGKEGSLDKDKDEGEPVLVMDGEHLKGTKELPKHLQEFVSITKEASIDGESECSLSLESCTCTNQIFH